MRTWLEPDVNCSRVGRLAPHRHDPQPLADLRRLVAILHSVRSTGGKLSKRCAAVTYLQAAKVQFSKSAKR